jgi:hypothetical protein
MKLIGLVPAVINTHHHNSLVQIHKKKKIQFKGPVINTHKAPVTRRVCAG